MLVALVLGAVLTWNVVVSGAEHPASNEVARAVAAAERIAQELARQPDLVEDGAPMQDIALSELSTLESFLPIDGLEIVLASIGFDNNGAPCFNCGPYNSVTLPMPEKRLAVGDHVEYSFLQDYFLPGGECTK